MYSDKIKKILAEAEVLFDDLSGWYMRTDGHFASDADIRCALEDWLIKRTLSIKYEWSLMDGSIFINDRITAHESILEALISLCEDVA